MLFNSFEYLIFLPAVVVLYYLIPPRYRWVLLLVASYYFYMSWKAEYIVLIAGSSLLDYYLSRGIAASTDKNKRKLFLILSLLVNLGVLFTFKYVNFFGETVNTLIETWGMKAFIPYYDLILPVGISFYTFQTLSYTIDVYKGKTPPAGHLGKFMVFVAFFPQLVAGPIERSGHLLPQFDKKVSFNPTGFVHGLRQILWGLFKKIVIADRLAIIVNTVYADNQTDNGFLWLLATLLFAFQIYCDFSGYSDIAIGSARLLGIKLMDNFKMPYFSRSIREFWSRWHISLSTWFRDYVYIPLGGNRKGHLRTYFNLMVVFTVSGLWHGANWTFIIWGGWHGLLLIIERFFRESPLRAAQVIKSIFSGRLSGPVVFLAVLLGWVFFRANDLTQAGFALSRIVDLTSWHGLLPALQEMISHADITMNKFMLSMVFLLIFVSLERYSRGLPYPKIFNVSSKPLRWAYYYATIFFIIFFGNTTNVEFIYFQF